MISILDAMFNIVEGNLSNHLTSTRVSTLIMNEIFMRAPKIMQKVAMALIGTANHLALMSCCFHISGEVGY